MHLKRWELWPIYAPGATLIVCSTFAQRGGTFERQMTQNTVEAETAARVLGSRDNQRMRPVDVSVAYTLMSTDWGREVYDIFITREAYHTFVCNALLLPFAIDYAESVLFSIAIGVLQV